jgi:hypothetical protein
MTLLRECLAHVRSQALARRSRLHATATGFGLANASMPEMVLSR